MAPGTPGTPTLTSAGEDSLTLACAAPASGGAVATYRWRYSINSTLSTSDPEVTSSGPSVTITGLDADTPYWIEVRAENAAGNSAYSGDLATRTAEEALEAPGTPGTPTLTRAGTTSLTLACEAPTTGGAPTLYRWRYSLNDILSTFDPEETSTGPSVTITGLQEDADYWIEVRAENSAGNSDYSGDLATRTASGAPATTVTANAGADKTVASGGTVTLDGSATVTNGSGTTAYAWSRVSGLGGSLDSATDDDPDFTAPTLTAGGADRDIVWRLTATNNGVSDSDDVTVTVEAPPAPGLATSSFTDSNLFLTGTTLVFASGHAFPASWIEGGVGQIQTLQVSTTTGRISFYLEESDSEVFGTPGPDFTASVENSLGITFRHSTGSVTVLLFQADVSEPYIFTPTNAQSLVDWIEAAGLDDAATTDREVTVTFTARP